jgi:hypothetical protein
MYGPKIYNMAPIDMYYGYLNCGFRISASSGSDKMSTTVPMGSARVYVNTGAELDYASWIEGIRSGKTFFSTGPMIEMSVDGKGPGDEIKLSSSALKDGKVKLKVTTKSSSRMAYDQLEIIRNGRVVATAVPKGDHFEAEVSTDVAFDRSGWVAARCYGREMLPYGGPAGHWFRMPVIAHTNPVWVTIEGRPSDPGDAPELFLDQIEHLKEYVLYKGRYGSDAGRQHALDQIEAAQKVYRELAKR